MKKIIYLICFLSLIGCTTLSKEKAENQEKPKSVEKEESVKYTFTEELLMRIHCELRNTNHILKYIATRTNQYGGRWGGLNRPNITWSELNKELYPEGKGCAREIRDIINKEEK